MGAALFRHRLAVILLAFAAALASTPLTTQGGWWANAVVVAGVSDTVGLVITGALCLLAAALRIAGEARLGAAVYAQGDTAGLVDSGIYAWLRNPLYWGTWLFFVALASQWAPLVVLVPVAVAFAAALNSIVGHEEGFLVEQFGEPYRQWCARVPRWRPRLGGESLTTGPEGLPSTVAAGAVGSALVGNLGLVSFGVYRLTVGVAGQVRGLGLLNVVLCALWVSVVIWRRRQTSAPPGGTLRSPSTTSTPTTTV